MFKPTGLLLPAIVVAVFSLTQVNAQKANSPRKAAILLFDGVQIIDYTGPFEVLGYGFDVITVAPDTGMITTNMGMKVLPGYSIRNCPKVDVLVLPGGYAAFTALDNRELINWFRQQYDQTEILLSVCNGAFFLQRAGLLEGLEATTTAGFIDTLQQAVPSARIVRNKRFVDNGKIITTAGLSSGIEGALHVAARLLGKGWEPVFARWLEYNHDPRSTYAAGMLADCNVSGLLRYFYRTVEAEPLLYAGDTKSWNGVFQVKGLAAGVVLADVHSQIVSKAGWKLKNLDAKHHTSTWSFTGKDHKPWRGQVAVSEKEEGKLVVAIKIARL